MKNSSSSANRLLLADQEIAGLELVAQLEQQAHSQARRSISPWFFTMGLRLCGRNLVGASTVSLRGRRILRKLTRFE
jgi:hypothetical protein